MDQLFFIVHPTFLRYYSPYNSNLSMCYQVVEIYAQCRCLYYQHDEDRCPQHSNRDHQTIVRTIYVGYTCVLHTPWGYSLEGDLAEVDFMMSYSSRAVHMR